MIYVLGGGGGSAYAFIIATYPEGSVITCTNSVGKRKLSNTKIIFYVKKPRNGETQTCHVECNRDGRTAFKNVDITYEGQSVSVSLAYELVIYNRGIEEVPIVLSLVGGGSYTRYSTYIELKTYAEYGWNASVDLKTRNAIDMSSYSTLSVVATRSGSHSTTIYIKNGSTDVKSKSINNSSSEITYNIDISDVNSLCTIDIQGVGGHGSGGSSSGSANIYSIILS